MAAESEQAGGSETTFIVIFMLFKSWKQVMLGLLEGVLLLVCKGLDAKTKGEQDYGCE
ncbi:hypothetical protein SDC9_173376 [bioreactor metagenome]|uniref:Uncharacterized protein n=1 Tax=bioreactor metagenome TaxID=1076179 RepID=A0A645GGY5_9ZZZZ